MTGTYSSRDGQPFSPELILTTREAQCAALRAEAEQIGLRIGWVTEVEPPTEAVMELAQMWAVLLDGCLRGDFDDTSASVAKAPGWLSDTPVVTPGCGIWDRWVITNITGPLRRLTRWAATSARFHEDALNQLAEIESAYTRLVE